MRRQNSADGVSAGDRGMAGKLVKNVSPVDYVSYLAQYLRHNSAHLTKTLAT